MTRRTLKPLWALVLLLLLGAVLVGCAEPEPRLHSVESLGNRRQAVRGRVKVPGIVKGQPTARPDGAIAFTLSEASTPTSGVPVIINVSDLMSFPASELAGREVIITGTFDGDTLHGQNILVRSSGPYDATPEGSRKPPRLVLEDVREMHYWRISDTAATQTATPEQVRRFVEAYADATSLSGDFGTTPQVVVSISLNAGGELRVSGGGETYSTVDNVDPPLNLEGSALHEILRELSTAE